MVKSKRKCEKVYNDIDKITDIVLDEDNESDENIDLGTQIMMMTIKISLIEFEIFIKEILLSYSHYQHHQHHHQNWHVLVLVVAHHWECQRIELG